MANQPRTSSRASRQIAKSSSIATTRTRQRDNNDKLQNDPSLSGSASTRIVENMELGIHTGNGMPYDNIIENGVKYRYPAQFESVTDRSDRIPPWQSVSYGFKDPHATLRTTPAGQVVGYEGRKQPASHQYTMADNSACSAGGIRDASTHYPTYSDKNHVSASDYKTR